MSIPHQAGNVQAINAPIGAGECMAYSRGHRGPIGFESDGALHGEPSMPAEKTNI